MSRLLFDKDIFDPEYWIKTTIMTSYLYNWGYQIAVYPDSFMFSFYQVTMNTSVTADHNTMTSRTASQLLRPFVHSLEKTMEVEIHCVSCQFYRFSPPPIVRLWHCRTRQTPNLLHPMELWPDLNGTINNGPRFAIVFLDITNSLNGCIWERRKFVKFH